jgi:hypothetical protein
MLTQRALTSTWSCIISNATHAGLAAGAVVAALLLSGATTRLGTNPVCSATVRFRDVSAMLNLSDTDADGVTSFLRKTKTKIYKDADR